ncbi:MAG: tRNA1(Val) (adenine(37)-N6)-methyltransferase [Defluviitaleaceae bacterium]|nr:tRNA1(Val) (adenine(37)-N6)-methyltransferase [Defluviitaleaceae bacterium]
MLKRGERLDDLHRDGLKIIQNPAQFCFGMDAALLSSFARVHHGQRHLDLCTGNGVIPLLLSAKTAGESFIGIEIQEDVADMARRSIKLNNLEDRIKIIHGDIREIKLKERFDVVTANPPYMQVGHGEESPNEALRIARHEVMCTLDDVILAASQLLVSKGKFYMVHRPARMVEMFASMQTRGLAPKILRLVQPKAGEPPNMLLIMAAKGGNAGLDVLAPLIVYGEDGKYTEEVRKIYYE